MSQHSDNEDATSPPPAKELLVHGRSKRATAGNRLQFLLQHLEDEDVRNDLLAEDETDLQDYELSDTEDVAFGSSDDSDDEGPPKDGHDEDLTGEKELQKHERLEARKKKRKAADVTNINPLQKRQRIGLPNSLLAPRPRKKSERISWLPTVDDAPTRQSNRRQTVANKEQTEAKLQESQKRSEKAHELLKIAAERKAARAVPALTQADRMARALKVEKENSKSLNRWEKAEEERQLQQRLRLEALRDRQLEGPVIRYWSGAVIWEGEKIKVKRLHQPKIEPVVAVEKPKDPKPDSAPDADGGNGHDNAPSNTPTTDQQPNPEAEAHVPQGDPVASDETEKDTQPADAAATTSTQPTESVPSSEKPIEAVSQEAKPSTEDAAQNDDSTLMDVDKENDEIKKTTAMDVGKETTVTEEQDQMDVDKENKDTAPPAPAPPAESASFLDGIHFWASQSPDAHAAQKNTAPPVQPPVPEAAQGDQAPKPSLGQHTSGEQPQQPIHPIPTLSSAGPSTTESNAPSPAATSSTMPPPDTNTQQPPPQSTTEPQQQQQPPTPQPPPIPLIREQAQRSLIILEAFPELDPTILPTTTTTTTTSSSRKPSSTTTTSTTLISSILMPLAHPHLSTQESRYLTSKSKRKDIIPPPPPKPICAITAKPARFRDPGTGIGYRDLEGYKLLKRTVRGEMRWSDMFGSWMGAVGRVAEGVPEGFLTGKVVRKVEDEEAKEKEDGDEEAKGKEKEVKAEELSSVPVMSDTASAQASSAQASSAQA